MKPLSCGSWFHFSFEHFDVISMVDKCIHLFQLTLLLRRMMHDPCFIARGALLSKSSKLCARNKPRNLESKRC